MESKINELQESARERARAREVNDKKSYIDNEREVTSKGKFVVCSDRDGEEN